MTQIGRRIARAFVEGRRLTIKHTEVFSTRQGMALCLHSSVIARTDDTGLVWMTPAGWPTMTTRDRLNCLCDAYGAPNRFRQRAGEQFYGDLPVDTDEWVPMAGPLAMQAIMAERRLAAA